MNNQEIKDIVNKTLKEYNAFLKDLRISYYKDIINDFTITNDNIYTYFKYKDISLVCFDKYSHDYEITHEIHLIYSSILIALHTNKV